MGCRLGTACAIAPPQTRLVAFSTFVDTSEASGRASSKVEEASEANDDTEELISSATLDAEESGETLVGADVALDAADDKLDADELTTEAASSSSPAGADVPSIVPCTTDESDEAVSLIMEA